MLAFEVAVADSAARDDQSEIDEFSQVQALVPYSLSYTIALRKLKPSGGLTPPDAPLCIGVRVFRNLAGVKFLTKLTLCQLSISHLPPQIGCLKTLEELDVSFNKLKHLPDTISELTALKFFSAANNKLVDLPTYMSNLQRLISLDLSNNKLTSMDTLDLAGMPVLQLLNIQDNKLHNYPQALSWVCCDLEVCRGNLIKDESFGQLELKELDMDNHRVRCISSCTDRFRGILRMSRRTSKDDKHRDSLQECARQERLNYSRNCRGSDDGPIESQTKQMSENMSHVPSLRVHKKPEVRGPFSENQAVPSQIQFQFPCDKLGGLKGSSGSVIASVEPSDCQTFRNYGKDKSIGDSKSDCAASISCITSEISEVGKIVDFEDEADSSYSPSFSSITSNTAEEIPFSSILGISLKSKRRNDNELDNPKPSKCRRPVHECVCISFKYSTESFCGIDDRLPDGFYDAGRDRPFLPLQCYTGNQFSDSREIILLDRRRDEELDAIVLSARLLLSRLRTFCDSPTKEDIAVNNFQRASVLALFVSDLFGGSDRSSSVAKMRKAASGSNKQQPFVCTCSSIYNYGSREMYHNYNFTDVCENSLRFIKETLNSNIIPIGALRLGICRHRALLMKYLCDRMDPPVPCELVRGYQDYMPHAWNVVLVRHGQSFIRMVVDTCNPTDIRAETDPEYFCRYIPLSRCLVPLFVNGTSIGCYPPVSVVIEESEKESHCSVRRCRYGTLDAAVKVHNLEICGVSHDDAKLFEYNFLGEVRILGALRNHHCIVEMYGHQFSSKWIAASNGFEGRRLLQSFIIMEYMNGGCLKAYLEELSMRGAKHAPVDLAIYIARDIACALVEVHSKNIIHRDIKSENILIDLGCKRVDGSPIVKLSDFDRAVPLKSSIHACCIAHLGVHPPDICVGTPRWMAPEVLQAIHRRSPYGLEVDIWSFGCILFELLTLKIPYEGHLDSEIYNLILNGQRPTLAPELVELAFSDQSDSARRNSQLTYSCREKEKLKLLIELFCQCTRGHPADRPTAKQIYDLICNVVPPLTAV